MEIDLFDIRVASGSTGLWLGPFVAVDRDRDQCGLSGVRPVDHLIRDGW